MTSCAKASTRSKEILAECLKKARSASSVVDFRPVSQEEVWPTLLGEKSGLTEVEIEQETKVSANAVLQEDL